MKIVITHLLLSLPLSVTNLAIINKPSRPSFKMDQRPNPTSADGVGVICGVLIPLVVTRGSDDAGEDD